MKEFDAFRTLIYFLIIAAVFCFIFLIDWGTAASWHDVEVSLQEPLVAKNWHYVLLLAVIWSSSKS